ncbi:MAG: UPF0158 family protein [Pseudomonas sp.]|uniref:UPF0158 family protein n=1 Tax=Pseudomonas sp. TaxID=306 RepID=UPI003393FE5B
MRPLIIDLAALAAALASIDADAYYLDLQTGSVLATAPGEPAPGALEKYQVEADRYLPIDRLPPAQTLAVREGFLYEVADPLAHAALRQALDGRKALRNFDYALERWPAVRQAWLAYQVEHLHDLALEWLQVNGLDAAPGR